MTRFARIALALGALVLLIPSLWAWPAAGGQGTSFYVDCAFSLADGVLRVRINDEEGLVRRLGDRIQVLAPTGAQSPAYEEIDCGGTATVNNTDLIRVEIDNEPATFTSGRLSLGGGPFAPGRTPESGVPEIEILTSAREEAAELRIEGTRRADHFRAGRLSGGAGWVNLNPNAEGSSADADLRLPSWSALTGFATGRGDDTVTANGGPEFNRRLGPRGVFVSLGRGADYYTGRNPRAFVFPGRGADTVVTGRRRDLVIDLRGKDSIRTRGGSDAAFAVGGQDRVWTSRGKDLVYTKDGRRDRVNCGAGSDRAALDARDRARSCERELDLDKSAFSTRSPYSALRLLGPTRR